MRYMSLIVLVMVSGCCSIKLEHVMALETSLKNERKAVTIRAGFENDVSVVRSEQDNLIETMKKALK